MRALLARGPLERSSAAIHQRATLYDYRFTDWTTGRSTGAWWTRGAGSPYLPPLMLDAAGALRRVRLDPFPRIHVPTSNT